MTTRKKVVSPRLSPEAEKVIGRFFPNRNRGAQFAIEAFCLMYMQAIDGIRGSFSPGELSLIIKAYRNIDPTTQHHQIFNALSDVYFGSEVDKNALFSKLRAMDPFSRLCLEVWASGYWSTGSNVEKAGMARWAEFLQ